MIRTDGWMTATGFRHRRHYHVPSKPDREPKEVRTLLEDGEGRRRRHPTEEGRKLNTARCCISAPLRHRLLQSYSFRAFAQGDQWRSRGIQGTALFGQSPQAVLVGCCGSELSLAITRLSAARYSVVLPSRKLSLAKNMRYHE